MHCAGGCEPLTGAATRRADGWHWNLDSKVSPRQAPAIPQVAHSQHGHQRPFTRSLFCRQRLRSIYYVPRIGRGHGVPAPLPNQNLRKQRLLLAPCPPLFQHMGLSLPSQGHRGLVPGRLKDVPAPTLPRAGPGSLQAPQHPRGLLNSDSWATPWDWGSGARGQERGAGHVCLSSQVPSQTSPRLLPSLLVEETGSGMWGGGRRQLQRECCG